MKKVIIFILAGFLIFPALSQSADEYRLRSAMESGCLENGSLKRQISTGRIFYRKESVQQPGKMIKFYADMTFEFEDGSKSGKWKCPQLNQNSSNSSSSSNAIVALSILLGLSDFSSSSSNNSSSSFSDRTPSQSGSSSSGSEVCSYCKPNDSKGHYIQDFDINSRTYKNGRYILRPGHKKCDICYGTGRCMQSRWSDAPGICDENYTCLRCKGDRFIVCNDCRGSGFRSK